SRMMWWTIWPSLIGGERNHAFRAASPFKRNAPLRVPTSTVTGRAACFLAPFFGAGFPFALAFALPFDIAADFDFAMGPSDRFRPRPPLRSASAPRASVSRGAGHDTEPCKRGMKSEGASAPRPP